MEKEAHGKNMVNVFTSGNIPRQLISFAIPFMLSNAMQVCYALVDMVVVGRFVGSEGLSAVSNASQIMTFCTMMCLGFSTGGQVYIAQLIGAGKRERVSKTVGTMFSSLFLLGIFLTAVILAIRTPVLKLIQIPNEARDMAYSYITVCGIGLVFTFGYNMVSAVLRGMGDSKHPFLFIAIASAVNLILDLVFTGWWKWGVTGAALATVLGQALSFIVALMFLYRRKEIFGFDFQPKSFQISGDVLKVLTRLGIPFAIQSCAINISMIFVNTLVNGVGVTASAAFGVGVKLDDIATKLTQGIMHAVSPMVGQNVAARENGRAKKVVAWGILYSAALYMVFTVGYIFFCKPMFALFANEQEVIELAPIFVSAVVWGFPAMVLMRGFGGFVQGIGFAKLSMILGILDGFVCRITLSYLCGIVFGLGFWGFVFGFGIAAYAFSIPAGVYFFSRKWEKRRMLV